ncbi:hypothetical protein BLNAU_12361 [Blattamonas nauphoetae]|uniref:Uncharacterized protein n=1 Tax=Blattamonas nauphoetae TaxID=2049346 RepID=A0ABQ9XMT6_9EUKA|nr:hypothetical protein BLNAU_12361 [Blattamonas nauphoetae]
MRREDLERTLEISLRIDREGGYRQDIVPHSIELNSLFGMSLRQLGWTTTLDSLHPPSPKRSSRFLDWDGQPIKKPNDQSKMFTSLVSMLKEGQSLDDSLVEKIILFLKQMSHSLDADSKVILCLLPSTSAESMHSFLTTITVFLSSSKHTIIAAFLEMLNSLLNRCSSQMHLALVKADLIPRLITTLNPQSLSFAEAVEIHSGLMSSRHGSSVSGEVHCIWWWSDMSGGGPVCGAVNGGSALQECEAPIRNP